MIELNLRKRLQAVALAGSAGQGACRDRQCIHAASRSSPPATINTTPLYSEITVIHGAAPIKPASEAPMPIVTSSAGKAQQIRVPTDVNRLSDGRRVCRHKETS